MKKNINFETRLFLFCALVITLMISISFISFYIYTAKDLEKRASQTLTQLTAKTMEQIDSMVEEMDKISIRILSNPTVLNIFSKTKTKQAEGNYFSSTPKEMQELTKTILSLEGPDVPVARTVLYNNSGDYVEYGIYSQVNQAVTNYFKTEAFKRKYDRILTKPGLRILEEPHTDYWSDDSDIKLISLCREIKNFESYENYGVVQIEQPYEKLESICAIPTPNKFQVYLVTDTGNIAYPLSAQEDKSTGDLVEYYSKHTAAGKTGSLKVSNPMNNKSELLTYKTSSLSNWTLIMVESESNILSPIYFFGKVLLLFGISILILTLTIIFIVTNRMAKPLKQLKESLKAVNLANLSVEISTDGSSNELVQLNEAFDSMFKSLKNSIDQVMQYKSQEAKAHVLALQSQMDPHFLYNVLSIITAVSYESGVTKIADISCRLSSMLRYVTSFQDKGTTIKDEIEHAENYLQLMKERYEDRLQYIIHISSEVLDINVPKMILQPMVENCFQHGFKEIDPPWLIDIEIKTIDGFWYMEVCDNGSGFDKSTSDRIMSKAEEFLLNPSSSIKEIKIGGLGILNIYMRLKLLYGENIIFRIESNSDKGTKIVLGGKIQ